MCKTTGNYVDAVGKICEQVGGFAQQQFVGFAHVRINSRFIRVFAQSFRSVFPCHTPLLLYRFSTNSTGLTIISTK